MRLLIEAGSGINNQDRWGYTPLHEAAIKGKADVCIVLLQSGGDSLIRNADGKTAADLAEGAARQVLIGEYKKDELLEAARAGNEERLVQLLTPLNVNCTASDGRRSSPLHLAAGYNRVRIVQILLKQGLFVGPHWPMGDVLAKDKGGLVPLHNSCSYGHIEVVEILLQCGANPNTCDLWQFTPLHEAAAKGRVEVCSLLVAHGADPNLNNCHGKSSVECASSKELSDRLQREFRGAQLLESCRQSDVSKVRKLVTSEIINFVSPLGGETPLIAAVSSPFAKRRSVVDFLLRKGAGVQMQARNGSTALHYAAQFGHVESAELLLRHGAQLNVKVCFWSKIWRRFNSRKKFPECNFLQMHFPRMQFCAK